jgi:dynein heavy chain
LRPKLKKDIGPKYELEKWKYRIQRLTSVNDFFKSNDFRIVSKYFNDLKNKSVNVVGLLNDMKQKKIDSHSAHNEAKDNVKYLSTLEIYI